MWYSLNFIAGLIFGSFLNVILYRSVEGIKLWNPPRSFCPNCGTTLKWYDNIPVLSYVLLKGKCRYCGVSISKRYPTIELTLGIAFLIHSIIFQPLIAGILNVVIFITIAVVYIDFSKMLIPDFAWISILLIAVIYSLINKHFLLNMLLASFIFFILLILKILYKEGIGMGDVLLMPSFVFLVGFPWGIYLMLIASISGIVYTIFSGKKMIPFGPFIALSGYILMFGLHV
ncbi:prepilin peptidase [Thermosipho ferrireducens]|uniref:Prepilin peptidase n=1 Tax=Thermosipho ferrireducens TaxID=2571116 RepID=A0ABX7S7D3_9BACT|nr:A24 family peptidase [Thermosipho ferrireducens]QTA37705.1 prepilin peptidase [Thermosipho ferrireducens]